MKLINYFKNFLDNQVNLNSSRIKTLDERTEAITQFLKNSDLLEENFIDVIPQGSYAHKTIIKPVRTTDEYDADILLQLEEFTDWEAQDYVENLYTLFRGSNVYRDKVSRKTRCVTITYANDFHMDIVPFMERHGQKYITNRHENIFELTDPEKFTDWLDERSRITKHHFVKVVRLIKYIRDYKRTFSVKSIILNTLLGEQINDAALLENENCYDDVPTALYNIMKKLKNYVESNYYIPTIADPSETGENFGDRWDQDGWLVFRDKMIYYSDKITDAYEDQDLNSSLEKWQSIFGEEFKKTISENSKLKQLSDGSVLSFNDTEERLEDHNIQRKINPRYKVTLKGRVTPKNGFRTYNLSERGNKVDKGRSVAFSVTCNVPQPYTIYWKVLNRGDEALRNDCIRGQIKMGYSSHTEPTSFRGNHYVECYIVKEGICVAMDRQSVFIV
ncbi:cyclic GMP-AMP synthase DncV-like nucleotidyltransferase [Chryseobacterium sp.]|uniref:SMODS domain-containing nucleotidyltransferase n=1 Tax=Chryseobacterium sp. TaxID=1871047 RepID=UPI0023F0363B|nr:hypothetical protein [Chryseobacterium sp.]